VPDFDTERDPVDVLAEEFAERHRRGETPSVSEYVERYPEWANQLRELLPPVARMEQMKRLKRASGAQRTDGPRLEQLGDYRIVREVGRGGMGIVYEAVQQSLGRHVALKVLPGHALLDPKKLERFKREAQAAANLHHTNIVPVFGVGEQDGLHYYVMQFIEGQGLDRVVAAWRHSVDGGRWMMDGGKTDGHALPPTPDPAPARDHQPPTANHPPRWRQIARIGAEAAEALHYAHQQGTLHRDIKPANLLLDAHGATWITDFGLAKLIDQDGLTSTGDILGTLQYMAPESLQGRADARSDVYSLGLTLYELLTLEPPFRGPDMAALLGSVNGAEPPAPRKVNRAVPRDLETIVLKAIARDPAHRYPTAAALAEDLRRYLDDRPILARRSTPVERLRRWCRRNPAVATLTAALVVVFLCGFGLVFWKWQEAEAESRRAEDNLLRAEKNEQLSLRALEEIFENLSRREVFPSFFRGPAGPFGGKPGPFVGPPPRPFDSEEDAALLQSVLTFYDRFARQNATNAKLQREAARAYRRVGDIQRRLGQPGKANAAYRRAATMLEKLDDGVSSTPEERLEWAEVYTLAEVPSSAAGELEWGERRLRKALAIAEEASGLPEASRAGLAARARLRLGAVLQQLGRSGEAEEVYREAVRLEQARAGEPPAAPFARLDLAVARQALADFFAQDGRPTEARAALQESIKDLRDWRVGGPAAWARQKMLIGQYQALATVLTRLGATTPAAEAAREAERLEQAPPFEKPRPGPGRDKRPRP
jgi:serine/threonine protein kinase